MNPIVPQTLIHRSVIQQVQTMPLKERKVVEKFLYKFGEIPTASGIIYEKIPESLDNNYRAVCITSSIYGVVKKPDRGNLYLMLCVSLQQSAYEWARDHRCLVNSYTGAIQVSGKLSEAQKTESMPDPFKQGIFANQDDRLLLKLGVPEDLLLWIKNVATADELSSVYYSLSETVYESLLRLAAGTPMETLLNEHSYDSLPVLVDTEDYSAAATNPLSLQSFVSGGDHSFREALRSPLEAWRVFLHPSQRVLVEKNWSGAVRVLGEAGTGKTVVILHRAKVLVERIYTQSSDRVLVTTFSRNLASDIRERLSEITEPEAFVRLDVVNLDQWLNGVLHKLEPTLQLLYDNDKKQELWKQAILNVHQSLTYSFLSEEWDRIILAQGILTLEDYLRASRAGRGKSLNEKARQEAWSVFQAYREILRTERYIEPADAMRLVRELIEKGEWSSPYRSVVVDEAQDMGIQALKLLSVLAGLDHENNLMIAGDSHQRIYPRKTSLSICGINIRGRSRKLKLSYRTPEEIRKFAIRLLEGLPVDDLDDGFDTSSETIALRKGTKPEILNYINSNAEVEGIAERIMMLPKEALKDSCLVARTSKQLHEYEQQLNNLGVLTYRLPRQNTDDRTKQGLRIATMHRVKGLEFEHIFIAGVNKGIVPMGAALTDEQDLQERSLFYVALTRAKTSVIVSSCGKPSDYLL